LINSKTKGKVGEREWRDFIKKKFKCNARRGVQYSGDASAPDVVSDLPFFFEVKRRNALSVYEAIGQVVKDANGSGKIPTVAWRKDRREWLIILRADDFARLKWEIVSRDEDEEKAVAFHRP